MQTPIKLYFVEKFSEGDKDAQLDAMRQYFTFTNLEECDVIYCAAIYQMEKALLARGNSGKPLVVYCWDYYLWAHEGKHHDGSDWKKYAQMLKSADVVLVPSIGQKLRLQECLGIDSVVVKTGFPTYDIETTDEGFILDPLRYYPEENRDWAEKAAHELGIPIIHSEHQYSKEDFQKLVASCTFLTSCVREASTGALTLMEGLYLGKPSLISNSPYMGAKDYLGKFATEFQFDDFEDLKVKMKTMWNERKRLSTKVTRKYIQENLTYDSMAKGIYDVCKKLI